MLTKQVGCARAQALLKGSSTRIRQLAGICSLEKATEDHTLNPKPLAVYIAEGCAPAPEAEVRKPTGRASAHKIMLWSFV